jgi:Flp pilus assembly protein TadG
MSAVEFAMVLPVLLTFYLGTAEVSVAVGIDRKVTLTTRTAADLVSQVASINNADMNNLLSASTAVMGC